MKLVRLVAATAALVAFVPLVQAQTRTTARAGARQPTRSARTVNIAVIDTTAFTDQKIGINRVVSAMRQLQAKYEPVRAELVGMRNRLEAMRFDIQRNKGIQDPQLIAAQTTEADRLDLQIKRKAEEAQAKYNTDRVAVIDPLNKEVMNGLNMYAQAKGITVLIDINQVPVLFSAPHVNITKDFIADYNRTHPVTVGR
ncbi:MAG TPA: OmpH family outer membrane protein [Pyrinomonadaceae bacterium]|nr:OmpH family outer membrane protein [Pyrinomonadaceae bacterium]